MLYSIGIIFLPGFSEWSYWLVFESFNRLNKKLGYNAYQVFSIGALSKDVRSDLNQQFVMPYRFPEAPRVDSYIIVGGMSDPFTEHSLFMHELVRHHKGETLVGIASGVRVLAETGLLSGYRSVPWEGMDNRAEKEFRNISFVKAPFCMDKDRLTCVGKGSTLALILTWIAHQRGLASAAMLQREFESEFHFISPELNLPYATKSHPPQQIQPELTEALELMHSNVKEPLTTQEIANHIKMSRRQLERIFKKFLNTVPSQYYMKVRLESVRLALQNSNQSISTLADIFGFSSGAHLSTCYKKHYGISPSEDRHVNE